MRARLESEGLEFRNSKNLLERVLQTFLVVHDRLEEEILHLVALSALLEIGVTQ